MTITKNVSVFDKDAIEVGGYIYSTSEKISCRMATQRITDIILETDLFKHCSVMDMGCGDGFFTFRFYDQGNPSSITAVDAALHAVKIIGENKKERKIYNVVGDAHHLPWKDNCFDLVLIQSILHHDDFPEDMVREGFRLASKIIIHEPNGNNLGLKIIEKISPYHRKHGEKSYSSHLLTRWIETNGGKCTYIKFAGFVPIFCPDWMARFMKWIEPVIESIPIIRDFACSVVVLVGEKNQ